jgi:hypothetical protein
MFFGNDTRGNEISLCPKPHVRKPPNYIIILCNQAIGLFNGGNWWRRYYSSMLPCLIHLVFLVFCSCFVTHAIHNFHLDGWCNFASKTHVQVLMHSSWLLLLRPFFSWIIGTLPCYHLQFKPINFTPYHLQKSDPPSITTTLVLCEEHAICNYGMDTSSSRFSNFHNKHFISSPSFLNHNSWCSPCLWLWKPHLSPSCWSQKNTLTTSFTWMFIRLHHHSKLTPPKHAPYHFEKAQILFTTNLSHVSKPMNWCFYPSTLQPGEITTVKTMGQFLCSTFLVLVSK